MTTDSQRPSAKIYAFPARGRFAPGYSDAPKFNGVVPASYVAQAAVGSCWYHDEAIRDAETPRQN